MNMSLMGTFSGEVTLGSIFSCVSLLNELLWKEFAFSEANSFHEESTFFGRVLLPREANRKLQNLFPFVNMAETYESISINAESVN